METQQTLVIFKPDAVRRRLVGRILQRFEDKGLSIVQLHLRLLSRAALADHYQEHSAKPFFSDLIDMMTSGESIVAILEGPFAIEVVRHLIGDTHGAKARPGTIRGDFASGSPVAENLVHASADSTSAQREIRIFFGQSV